MEEYDLPLISHLINQMFSFQWCRDNIVVPLRRKESDEVSVQCINIGIANYSYLATIGDFIKTRAIKFGYSTQFEELDQREIEKIINLAFIESESPESTGIEQTWENKFIDALKRNDEINNSQYKFEFDDSEEKFAEGEILDLADEICGSEIQQASASLLIGSCRSNVSDIHIEPRQDTYKVRVRRDGVMQSYVSMPRSAGVKLTACLKNMAKMDIAERRASQDGKILRKFESQNMEFRCSTAPGKHGEKMVLRILNSNEKMLSLDTLINNDQIRQSFRDVINEANGIVIVSGPTGSGKSTTLASALREKDNGELNIVTAEDPIEYDLGGNIQQFPVLRAKGQTFAMLLRTFLRQDPDVILIGETHDPETAESCLDAAQRGHLIFTALHTNSACSSITHLLNMGIPTYKLTTSLRCVLAQRLMRKVCPECCLERQITESEARFTSLNQGTDVRVATCLSAEEKEERKLEGTLCKRCSGSGYQGRIGIYELLLITRNIREAIIANKSTEELEEIASQEGMLTLKAYAVKLIEQQLTTISELQKIC